MRIIIGIILIAGLAGWLAGDDYQQKAMIFGMGLAILAAVDYVLYRRKQNNRVG